MSLQTIDHKQLYVVDLFVVPATPVHPDGDDTIKYAIALTDAIETGVIHQPGKYGIYLVPDSDNYEIYAII